MTETNGQGKIRGATMHASRQPEDRDYGLPEGSRDADGSINADVIRASIKKAK
jgi:hypothetical protein